MLLPKKRKEIIYVSMYTTLKVCLSSWLLWKYVLCFNLVSFNPQLLCYSKMLLLFKIFICCFKFVYLVEMTSHSKRLGISASRIVASSIFKNFNMLLLFKFLICHFKSTYSMDMAFHYESLSAFRIIASSIGKNSILIHIVIFKS